MSIDAWRSGRGPRPAGSAAGPLAEVRLLAREVALAGAIGALSSLAAVGMARAAVTAVRASVANGVLRAEARAPAHASSTPQAVRVGALPGAASGIERAARSSARLLENAELVYGPAAAALDVQAVLMSVDPTLAGTSEFFRGTQRRVAEIVGRVAIEHGLSPRLLIALLALDAGASGTVGDRVQRIAAWVDDGYYGRLYRAETRVHFADRTARRLDDDGPAAHFAVARYLALDVLPEAWPDRLARFAAHYDAWFGPPPAVSSAAAASDGVQPELRLPWPAGETWRYTGGPHGGWGPATAWASVDFAPPTSSGCRPSAEWVVAAAPGVIAYAEDGLVMLDLDGDGSVGTGWVVVYLHVAGRDRVAAGTVVARGDGIGHPSCEGGRSDGAHVHIGRRLNGEWMPAAAGPAPLVLSGWSFEAPDRAYDGPMRHPLLGVRWPMAGSQAGPSQVVSDNDMYEGPLRASH